MLNYLHLTVRTAGNHPGLTHKNDLEGVGFPPFKERKGLMAELKYKG